MYGTVAHARVKEGHFDKLVSYVKGWDETRGKEVKGAVAVYVYRLDRDPNDIIMTAVFEDKPSYLANADDPDQDEWYRGFREHLEADPDWNDGEIVYNA